MEPDSEHASGLPRPARARACNLKAAGPHTLPVARAGGRNDRPRLRIASGVVLGVVAGFKT
jgi:hypothetical protein